MEGTTKSRRHPPWSDSYYQRLEKEITNFVGPHSGAAK